MAKPFPLGKVESTVNQVISKRWYISKIDAVELIPLLRKQNGFLGEGYNQSLAIAQAIGDKPGEANTLNNLGIAYQAQKNAAKAIESYTQALSIARAISDRRMEAITLGGLGLTYARDGCLSGG